MKNKISAMILTSFLTLLIFSTTTYANSSWIWLTDNPLTILPYAIIFTLIVEIITVIKLGKIKDYKKACLIIIIANLSSFILPYVFLAFEFLPFSDTLSISYSVNKGPYYIVLTGYLMMTILIELPITYFLLEKNTLNKKRLILSIITSNVATTLAVAIVERILYIAQW